MRSHVLALTIVLSIGSESRGESPSAEAVLPALETRLCSAGSVKVNFVESYMVEPKGKSERVPAGEAKGSLTVVRDGRISFSETIRLFGGAYRLDAVSDGKRLRVSGSVLGNGDGASLVDAPKNLGEHLLMSFVRTGSDLENVLHPASEGHSIDVDARFQVSATRLSAAKRTMPTGRTARALEYVLREQGTGYTHQVTLWIDVETGLPIAREVVDEGGSEGRMVSSATYEIVLEGQVPATLATADAERLFVEMEDKLIAAKSLEVEMKSDAEEMRIAVEAGGRVLVRTPWERIRSDGARVRTEAISSGRGPSAVAPPDFSREASKAFARGGYRRLLSYVRVAVADKGYWDGTVLSGFTWLRNEELYGRPADVIQYSFRGRYGNDTKCTLWIDRENRLPVKRRLEEQTFGAEPETEIYRRVRLNGTIDPQTWSN